MKRPRRFDEAGFTLVELVVTIVIMGIITLPIANFMLGYLNNYVQTETRVSDSHDVQIASAYFSQDVANTGVRSAYPALLPQRSVWTTSTGFPSTYCGTGLGTPILLLTWDDWPSGSGATAPIDSAAYVVESGTLHRVFCPGTTPSTPSTAATSDTTVVHNLTSGNPTTTCSTACAGASPVPTTISMTISVRNSADQAITLSGQRRQSSS